MKKSLAVMLALIMVLCMIPTTALAVPPGKQSVKIKLAYSDYGYEPTGSKGFTYTYSNPLQGGTGWIYTLGPVEQYVTSQEMSGYNFTGYIVMEKGKRVSKMPGDTWDLGQGNGGMLHVQLQKNNDTPTSSTLQVNTVINGDQTLTSSGTPFSVTVGNGYTPDDYKTGLDNSNYTYTFVKAERNSGKGLFKLTASSSGTIYADSKFRQFFPASGENVVAVYYTAKSKAAPPPSATPTPPDKPIDNDVPDIIGRGAVKVHCINDSSGSDDHSYNILPGSFSIGDVILKDGVYTCDITVRPELYVAEYVKDFGKPHTLSPAVQTGTITLIYYAENQVWDLMPNDDLPIVFTVTCSDEDETFTVTYLDGFSGTYATYTNLNYGDPTPVPANPYRSGYIFLGWEPSVALTVTDDASYVAQWGYIGPQYPNPTPVQPVQPGILPPQTGDMPLWYAIARFLGLVK